MAAKYLDNNGLLYVWNKLKDTFVKKTELEETKKSIPKKVADLVDAVNYAKVSSIPTKVENLQDAVDYAKKIDVPHSISQLEGIDLYAPLSKVPTKVAQLEDGSDYVKRNELSQEINTAIGSINSLSFSVVERLPDTGQQSTIYLVPKNKEENDDYDEFIWINDKFEKIGSRSVDLSGYLKSEEITNITNEEIDALFV